MVVLAEHLLAPLMSTHKPPYGPQAPTADVTFKVFYFILRYLTSDLAILSCHKLGTLKDLNFYYVEHLLFTLTLIRCLATTDTVECLTY